MPLHPTWQDIGLRIFLAVVAGVLVGFNRGEQNQAAGMRTTLLVCIAACLTMVLANLLLDTSGKDQKSFSQIDVLRLPLGMLSGMGFLGAGAIIKKDNMALGVTTAATLWFMTVVGLCFGAGWWQIGLAGVLLGLAVLWGLKWTDDRMHRRFRGSLRVLADRKGFSEEELRRLLSESRHTVVSWSICYEQGAERYEAQALLEWEGEKEDTTHEPVFLGKLASRPAVLKAEWNPQALSA